MNEIDPAMSLRECLSQLSIKTRIETLWQGLLLPAEAGLSQLSIKTRIETEERQAAIDAAQEVWVSYPLKQGLKHHFFLTDLRLQTGLSQLSIKTRIETPHLEQTSNLYSSVWVSYPLKQGLKQISRACRIDIPCVWVSYPLKQGLKRLSEIWQVEPLISLSQLSIKTRIETINFSDRLTRWQAVWVSYPLKQGLKPAGVFSCEDDAAVWVSYPLKQGLKLRSLAQWLWRLWSLSQLSIKTRIETACCVDGERRFLGFESAIH